jgi:hypothetical protein
MNPQQPIPEKIGGTMSKEKLIKLIEALASVGYEINKLNTLDPLADEIELTIVPLGSTR